MTRIDTRTDTAANWTSANTVLRVGECGFESNTRKFKYGDGVTAWNSLLYAANPVTVSKSDVGLGLVDNTRDVDKPVSGPQLTALNSKASLASPPFTGVPTAPTAAAGTNSTQLATTAFVQGLLAGPVLTGDPKAPTATSGDNDTSIATTAFVTDAVLRAHPIVKCAATANDALTGLGSRDGIVPTAGDLVLVPAQTTMSANGIYVAATGTWTRWVGAATSAQLAALGPVEVLSGTANGGTMWTTTFRSTDTVGTTAQYWGQINGAPPHFRGDLVGFGNTSIGAGSNIGFTVREDTDSAYASNVYTVKRAGVYRVKCQFKSGSAGAAGINALLLKNGSAYSSLGGNAPAGGYGSLGGDDEVRCVATDTLAIRVGGTFTLQDDSPTRSSYLNIDWIRS